MFVPHSFIREAFLESCTIMVSNFSFLLDNHLTVIVIQSHLPHRTMLDITIRNTSSSQQHRSAEVKKAHCVSQGRANVTDYTKMSLSS